MRKHAIALGSNASPGSRRAGTSLALPRRIVSRSTDTLRTARSRLTAWQTKIDALLHTVDQLEPEQRAPLVPLRQSLLDRLRSTENAILKLDHLETAWSDVGVDLQHSLRELDGAFAVIASKIEARGSPHTSN